MTSCPWDHFYFGNLPEVKKYSTVLKEREFEALSELHSKHCCTTVPQTRDGQITILKKTQCLLILTKSQTLSGIIR